MEEANEASRAHLFRIKPHPQPPWVKFLPVVMVGRILQSPPPTPYPCEEGTAPVIMFYDLNIGRLAQWAGSRPMNLKTGGRWRGLKQEGSVAVTGLNMERSTREGHGPALRRTETEYANPLNEHGSSLPRAPVGGYCPAGPWFQPVTP